MIREETPPTQGSGGARRATELPWVGPPDEIARQAVPDGERADPEVAARPCRRKFTGKYKLRILEQADTCTTPGSLGELLRREGLYSSYLTAWRRQRERGALVALTAKKRGRKEVKRDPLVLENETLRRDIEQLKERLRQTEIIIEIQKKISQVLGIQPSEPKNGGNG